MGRAPCCDKQGLKKGPWSPEEDKILVDYIQANGLGSWRSLPKLAGLLRCGKSCRLRWTNYLRPDIRRGPFTPEEQKSIVQLHGIVGNKWSTIAAQLPGRTDNEIKNYWNTHLKKRFTRSPDSCPPAPTATSLSSGGGSPTTRHMTQWESARLEAEARLSKDSLLFSSPEGGATTPSTVTDQSPIVKPEPDFFLRIWNSEIGEAFRSKDSVAAASPASSSTKFEPPPPKKARVADRADSTSSNEVEDTYQMYLNLVGDDMALGQLLNGGLDGISLFGVDQGGDGGLDLSYR